VTLYHSLHGAARTRLREYYRARRHYAYVLYSRFGLTYKEIGERLGVCTHRALQLVHRHLRDAGYRGRGPWPQEHLRMIHYLWILMRREERIRAKTETRAS
jgi:hypothetical protein